jgi:HEAT repeat protein
VDDLEPLLDDPATGLADPDPAIRRLALSMMAGHPGHLATVAGALDDPDAAVQAAAAETLGSLGAGALAPLLAVTTQQRDERVLEAAAASLGELADPAAVPSLMEIAGGSHDTLTRETAVASLGAIGDTRALPLLLELCRRGPPHVRRRAVVALTVFDGEDVEAAIRRARDDRNPMVREAAEMVLGRPDEE